MTSQVDTLIERCFPEGEGERVANLKFASGTLRQVTAEQLAAEVLSADEQIASGNARRVDNIDELDYGGFDYPY